MKVFDVM